MSASSNDESLPQALAKQREARCDQFEAALKAHPPPLEQFLQPEAPGHHDPACADQPCRRARDITAVLTLHPVYNGELVQFDPGPDEHAAKTAAWKSRMRSRFKFRRPHSGRVMSGCQYSSYG